MTPVVLTANEMYVAAMVGVRRRLSSMSAGFLERNGAASASIAEAWYYNIVGAQGEMAAAKALGVYWPSSIGAEKADPDMPPDWQVRTMGKSTYDLIVRKDDIDSHKYLLVTGTGPEFLVHGWIYGKDAKKEEWYGDRGGRNAPCFWVPKSALKAV